IGANTAVFSLVNGLLLRPLPVVRPDLLVGVSTGNEPIERSNFSYNTFDQIRRHAEAFDGALAFSNCCGQSTVTIGTERWAVDRFFVSGDFFSTLGLTPAAGRFFTPADDVAGGGADGPFTLTTLGGGLSALRQRFERPLLALLIVVGVVLLVACANIASLHIGRGAARGHELSVRLALGASRRQLAQQLFVESVVLAAAGTLAGFVFAGWASRAIVAQMSSSAVPVVIDLSADWRVLGFTSSVMVIAVLLFGTAPAVRATRVAPIDALKAHGRTVGGAGRWLSMIVVAQVALSLILVV